MTSRRFASLLVSLLVFFGVARAARADEPTPTLPETATSEDARVVASPQSTSWIGEPRAPKRRRVDPTLFGAGLATAIVGGVAINVGATMIFVASDPCMVMCADHVRHTDTTLQTAGVAVLASGIVLAAVGIPLAIAGGKKVPVSADARSSPFVLTF